MKTQDFLKPRLVGDRFEGHTLPLEILKDFSALEEMIVEIAKWEYLKAHPDSKRVERNFTKGLELHLAQVDEGSAIPVLVLAFSQLFIPENEIYYKQASLAVVESIAHVQQGLTPDLPSRYLSYFDRFGRGLRAGEHIEFNRPGASAAILTPDIRKRLIKFSEVQVWTEELVLRGKISEADQSKNSFHLELRDGTKLLAPLSEQHLDTVLEAFKRYRAHAHVLLQGIVKKNRNDKLDSIESVEHISLLDPLDVTLRLEELKELKDGWLDGKGLAPNGNALDTLAQQFDQLFDANLRLPYLYPTAEGGIQAEWSLPSGWEASLEIDLTTQQASFQALNLQTKEAKDGEIKLGQPEDWKSLNEWLTTIGGVEA